MVGSLPPPRAPLVPWATDGQVAEHRRAEQAATNLYVGTMAIFAGAFIACLIAATLIFWLRILPHADQLWPGT